MTPHRSVFVNFRQCVLPVSTTTGDVFYTKGYRDMILKLLNQDRTDSLPSLTLKKTKSGFIIFKHQDQTFGSPESIIGFATCEGEYYWLNCNSIDKVDYILNCNLITRSLNLVFIVRKPRSNIAPISVDLAYRRICHTGEDYIKKIEIYIDSVALKPSTGVTFPCTPCIKGKGHSLPFGKEPISIASYSSEHYFVTFTDNATRFIWLFLLKSRAEVTEKRFTVITLLNISRLPPISLLVLPKYLWGYLLSGVNYTINRLYTSRISISPYEALYRKKPDLSNLQKRATKLDLYIDKARLITYDEGDNYMLYNMRTKKIVRSRNPLSDCYVPVDFLNEYNYQGTPFSDAYFTDETLVQTEVQTILLRFGTPPPPTIEDGDSANLFTPVSPPLEASDPAILRENSSLSTIEDRLLNPDSFELPYDDKMAGSLGRHVEAQREDIGVHFEAGVLGVLVEPQSSSREAVNQDHT
ncbi:hypothetical protein N7530_003767 [Penicillium desertorum]|uniref:Uncharacterized protein n=1 Tax=Penicillium desertorum TaxID=1303715 RepID=A0A9W9WWX9_9EURO|nr:hypothetical protein N7530_003767 [Penicillium desertorum]